MRVYNGTSHDLKIYAKSDVFHDDAHKKYLLLDQEIEPYIIFPAQKPLSISFGCEFAFVDGIPIKERRVYNRDELPEGYDLYIVSALYARAFGGDPRIATVVDQVYDARGKNMIGCLALNITDITWFNGNR